jgi:hypothetical protein
MKRHESYRIDEFNKVVNRLGNLCLPLLEFFSRSHIHMRMINQTKMVLLVATTIVQPSLIQSASAADKQSAAIGEHCAQYISVVVSKDLLKILPLFVGRENFENLLPDKCGPESVFGSAVGIPPIQKESSGGTNKSTNQPGKNVVSGDGGEHKVEKPDDVPWVVWMVCDQGPTPWLGTIVGAVAGVLIAWLIYMVLFEWEWLWGYRKPAPNRQSEVINNSQDSTENEEPK